MEFACSHVVCDWRPHGAGVPLTECEYDNRLALPQEGTVKKNSDPAPPPLPPRRLKKPRPTSLPLPPFCSIQPHLEPMSLPPPVPPRANQVNTGHWLEANVNIISLSIGKLVNTRQVKGMESFQSPVTCGKCSASLSCLSSVQNGVWQCEFCGCDNSVDDSLSRVCVGQRAGVRSDDMYLPSKSEDEYQNLEDTLLVFCVDISGSMSVTTEVKSSNGSSTHISRLESIQDALEKTLASTLQKSRHRRVALVTFNDEVVIYGDGTSTPLTLRDWALVDYDHIWQQGISYSIPHCIAETYQKLMQRVNDLRDLGATSLGPAALASVAMASRYPGSKVILCTDGRANIGLGQMEETPSLPSSPLSSNFYRQLALQAVASGVIISVMTFEGTDCCLADVGRLADMTGGRVNIVNIGNVATEIESASMDNVLATGVTATLLASEGVFFPYEDENNHKLVRVIGNVTKRVEITFQFSVKPEFTQVFLQKQTLPFQVQLCFKTRDHQQVTRIITEHRPVIRRSRLWLGSLNMAIIGVHCAQLCAGLTMEGRVREAQSQLKAQQDLLKQISEQRPIQKHESVYCNWMDTMTTICDDITTESSALSDEVAKVVYQMKKASSISNNKNKTTARPKKTERKNRAILEGK